MVVEYAVLLGEMSRRRPVLERDSYADSSDRRGFELIWPMAVNNRGRWNGPDDR
jgi:hypothetical protein